MTRMTLIALTTLCLGAAAPNTDRTPDIEQQAAVNACLIAGVPGVELASCNLEFNGLGEIILGVRNRGSVSTSAVGNLFAVCDPYMMVPGITGEYSCDNSKWGIDFVSASISRNTLTLVKRLDKASPFLFISAAQGKHFPSVDLFVPSQQQKYTFTDVIVSSVTHGASPAAETVTFSFAGHQSQSTSATPRGSRPPVDPPFPFTVAGSAAPPAVAIAFLGEPATAFQTTFRMTTSGRASFSANLKMTPIPGGLVANARSTGKPVQGCTVLKRADGTPIAQFVLEGTLFPDNGYINIQRIQIQIPPAPACSWSTTGTTWDVQNNTAQ